MSWQDILFTVGGISFSVGLIPSILSKEKPARKTCAITAFFLYAFLFAYASYGLWLTFATTTFTATAWAILLFQRRE